LEATETARCSKTATRCSPDLRQDLDALSFDSDHETKTQTEQSVTAALVSQFADIGLTVGSIMGAVFFTLVLLTGNTMAQAVRERIRELAVLKTGRFFAGRARGSCVSDGEAPCAVTRPRCFIFRNERSGVHLSSSPSNGI
jgi:hypothetical protein